MEISQFERRPEGPADKKTEAGEQLPAETAEESAAPQKNVIDEGAPPAEIIEKDEELIVIQGILSDNIAEIYRQLSAAEQNVFRKKGEEAAIKIKSLLQMAKVRAHEILDIIKEWLRLLPRINHYFLEQEAKIKTDKILQLKREGQQIER